MPNRTTAQQRRELLELADRATPGPWKSYIDECAKIRDSENGLLFTGTHINVQGRRRHPDEVAASTRYIAAACNLAPTLAREVEELKTKIVEARAFYTAHIANKFNLGDLSDAEFIRLLAGVMNAPNRCAHCGAGFKSVEEASIHVRMCPEHPAVMRAEKLEKMTQYLAKALAGMCTHPVQEADGQGNPEYWLKWAAGEAEKE